ncbi:MAG: DUF1727 domain-containing protein [Candidatus Melainabacteria bacterium]|nr:DUF1727 domain-containing protein [Candidatus Melainabacteria bacterium]
MSTSDILAIMASQATAKAIRTLGIGLGSNLPGRLARHLSPNVLSRLVAQCRQGTIVVSGTNGKSTTSGLIHSILQRTGHKVVHNRQGANLVTGITAAVVECSSWDGKLDVDYCLFEIDEATLPVVASEVQFSAVVVTNLFRDQLDRFGELDTTAKLIGQGISLSSCQAILNADDPNVAQLSPQSSRLYYGIESLALGSEMVTSLGQVELAYCGQCGSEYSYDRRFYGQLGHYRCLSCGTTRQSPQVAAYEVNVKPGGSTFVLKTPLEEITIELSLPGLFNVYNALAASAVAVWLKIPGVTIADGLRNYITLFGRSERFSLDGKLLVVQLIKNPAGCSQVVASVARDNVARVLIAINDNLADGRDISWLWDADFEQLNGCTKEIVVSGHRAHDMALRLKYAGFNPKQITVIQTLNEALRHALRATQAGETLWILPTYTCLLELQKIFKSLGYALAGT